MDDKIIYIAHPIGAIDPDEICPAEFQIQQNLNSIQEIYAIISRTMPNVIPFCPYYATVMSLNDSIPSDREIGIHHNKVFFERKIITELWWFKRISYGVSKEIGWCKDYNIPFYAKTIHGGLIC